MLQNTREGPVKCFIDPRLYLSNSDHLGLKILLWLWIFSLLWQLSNPALSLPSTSYKILLNEASIQLLCSIPGLGKKRAHLIIQQRESQGHFKHLEELAEIKGIGLLFVRRITPYVRIR